MILCLNNILYYITLKTFKYDVIFKLIFLIDAHIFKKRKDAFEKLIISYSHIVWISLHGFKMHHGRCTV